MVADAALIRRERPDHPQVVALLAELDQYLASLYPPEANHIMDVQALLASEVHFFVAESGGQLLGCGAVRCMPGEPATGGRPYGEIKRMMTLPAARGQGLAAALMQQLEAVLREQGITLALLETGEEQQAAVRLYQRCGYVRRPAYGGYPDNGLSVFFEKHLP
ncbi:MAG: GNAT family N-acetyltransferase [Rubrivivax sp.]|nr:GNAT family N-acetyltransferase [Rubrivivax sp.]